MGDPKQELLPELCGEKGLKHEKEKKKKKSILLAEKAFLWW